MKTLWAAATALVVFAVAGNAFAQSTTPTPYMPGPWDGFYVGANAGYDWGHDEVGMRSTPNNNNVAVAGRGLLTGDGPIGGGQIGFNHELPGLYPPVVNGLVGLEADFDYTGLSDSRSAHFGNISVFEKFAADWLTTARVRVGATFWEQVLLYGTGGLAVADVDFSSAESGGDPFYRGNGSGNGPRLGWVGGGGVEWMFLPGWSVKAEFLYVDLGTANFTNGTTSPTITVRTRNHLTENIGRVGINYKFWSF
jgi:outer membrane immunogenic protein